MLESFVDLTLLTADYSDSVKAFGAFFKLLLIVEKQITKAEVNTLIMVKLIKMVPEFPITPEDKEMVSSTVLLRTA